MQALDELEATLRARWDRETLVVYGDHLQAMDDPRGELVALDLEIDDRGPLPELVARKDELTAAWVGDARLPGAIRYGFFDVDATSAQPDEQLAAAFRAAPARYIRSVTIVGDQATVARALALVTDAPRPWLIDLAIRQWSGGSEAQRIDGRALVEAAPHLQTLAIAGRRVLDLVHPAIHRLQLSGYEAISSLAGEFAGLVELDFAFQAHLAPHPEPSEAQLAALLPAARLTALRTLDLSRNEPGALDPDHLGGRVDVFEFIAGLAMRDRIEVLRLPSLRLAPQVKWLHQALSEMHALRELHLPSSDGLGRDLKHRTATIRFG